VLIAQAVYLLERGHTDKQTDNRQTQLNALPTPAAMQAWVIKPIAMNLLANPINRAIYSSMAFVDEL